jgi:uncharacterized protein YwqG
MIIEHYGMPPGMCWGDVGTLYWLIRPDDLKAHKFDQTVFTWQCS